MCQMANRIEIKLATANGFLFVSSYLNYFFPKLKICEIDTN